MNECGEVSSPHVGICEGATKNAEQNRNKLPERSDALFYTRQKRDLSLLNHAAKSKDAWFCWELYGSIKPSSIACLTADRRLLTLSLL